MSDTTILIVTAVISGPVGVVVGTFAGYWLNERATRQHMAQVQTQQNQSVRTLLDLEIQSNLDVLMTFWKRINALDVDGYEDVDRKSHLGAMVLMGLLGVEAPEWHFERWLALSVEIPRALTRQQIEAIDDLRQLLESVTSTFTKLTAMTSNEQQNLSLSKSLALAHQPDDSWYARFMEERIQFLIEMERLVEMIHEIGNPLRSYKFGVVTMRSIY